MIWLIGSKGMLGTELSNMLKDGNIEFVSSDIDVDITNENALNDFVINKNINWIINCSAYTAVDQAEDEPELANKINAIGPENIAKIANKIDAKLIHISTDYVFSGTENKELCEDDEIGPISVYGKSKLNGEENIKSVFEKFFIIRTAWLYGKFGNNFVYTMLRLFNTKEEISVVNDQVGSPTNTFDLSKAIIKIIELDKPNYGVYHFSNSGRISWFDFSNKILELAKKIGIINSDCKINSVSSDKFPTKAKRPSYSLLSKEKIKNVFNINIKKWDESLNNFLNDNLIYIKEKLEIK